MSVGQILGTVTCVRVIWCVCWLEYRCSDLCQSRPACLLAGLQVSVTCVTHLSPGLINNNNNNDDDDDDDDNDDDDDDNDDDDDDNNNNNKIMINLIYIAQFDTNGILTALYIVITYIQMQYVHV